jgi:hypothetical protein
MGGCWLASASSDKSWLWHENNQSAAVSDSEESLNVIFGFAGFILGVYLIFK